MKPLLYILIGIVVLSLLGSLVHFIVGSAVWVGLALLVGALVMAWVRKSAGSRWAQTGAANPKSQRRTERDAERALKDLEERLKR